MVNSQMISHEENTFSLYLHSKWYTVKDKQGYNTHNYLIYFLRTQPKDVSFMCLKGK